MKINSESLRLVYSDESIARYEKCFKAQRLYDELHSLLRDLNQETYNDLMRGPRVHSPKYSKLVRDVYVDLIKMSTSFVELKFSCLTLLEKVEEGDI